MTESNSIRRIPMVVAYTIGLAVLLFSISRVIGYMNKGADKATILRLPMFKKELHANYSIKRDGNQGAPIADETIDQITEDYLKAWVSKNVAISNHDPEYLTDHFTPKMQEQYLELIDHQKSKGIREDIVTLNHNIDIRFHNLDKSLVVIEDTHVIEHRQIYNNDSLLNSQTDTSAYQAICLKEDGHWRIRKLTSIDSKTPTASNNLSTNYNVSELKGINYYPQEYPWDAFNLEIDESLYKSDFERMQSLGINCQRIFIQYKDFGGAEPKPEKIKQLIKFLDLAEQYNIGTIITLFDFYGNYHLNDWTKNDHHTRTIVNAIKDHPALLAYDIKNEPDLDFDTRGKNRVINWLSHQVELIKSLDPKHPVTIGWSSTSAANILYDKLDFVSFHYYNSQEEFLQEIKSLKQKIGNTKPLFLTEFGISSYKGLWNPIQFSNSKQADYINSIVNQCDQSSVSYLLWTLYDYKELPNEVVGRKPWRKAYQRHYGIIDVDGNEKPSYQVIKGE